MTPEASAAEGPPGPLPYAAALALVLLLHLFFLFSGMTPVLDGLLPGGGQLHAAAAGHPPL